MYNHMMQEQPVRKNVLSDRVNIIKPRKRIGSPAEFMTMKVSDVIEKFMTLPGAQLVGEGDRSFVYVPPTREDSVLLVSHLDTVWEDDKVDLVYSAGVYASGNDKIGIGADDRAGVAMLWKLRKLGHALLLPNAEEKHGVGANFLMESEEWRKKINSHRFAIEPDRANSKDLVFYNGCASYPFKEWCKKNFTGYSEAWGSYSDIRELSDADKHKEDCIDSLNISVGYYWQHSKYEHLVESEWQRTLAHLHRVLSQKDLPKFHHKYITYTPTNYSYKDQKEPRQTTFCSSSVERISIGKNVGLLDSTLLCSKCDAMFDVTEYEQEGKSCPYCKEKLTND